MKSISENGEGELQHPTMADEEEEVNDNDLHLLFTDEVHQSNTLAALNKMRKNRHFCDVILYVDNTEIHAHRAVLASASPYLFELFTTDHEQNRTENIISYKLNGGFEKNALELLVNYAYTAQLKVLYHHVKSVYLAASHLKMDRVARKCAQHLIAHLSVDNSVEIRSLPGIARNLELMQRVDGFIANHFDEISKSPVLLGLYCVRIEVLNQSKEEMSLINHNSLCRLVLEWIKRQITDDALNVQNLAEKTFMLYLAIDNSLQDCSGLPSGDISDTEIVQDYKKLAQKNAQPNSKNKRKFLRQPSKPRVLYYSREIGEDIDAECEPDWNLIATAQVADHNSLALVTLGGRLATISVQLRLNTPTTPSPVTTPDSSRCCSEEKPDLYCAIKNMSSPRCAVGCGNLRSTLLVCGGYDRTECLRSVEQYFPETNTWNSLPPMKVPRGRFQIAILDDKVYAVGGSNGTTELDTVEMLDLSVGSWRSLPKLPLARSNLGVCDLSETIYCVGGWNGQVGIKQCDIFDPTSLTWSTIASLNTGRYQAGVTSYKNCVYAIGGCEAWSCLNSVEIYDPTTNQWTVSKPIITARRGCGVVVFSNKLYVVGGSDGTHSLNSTEIFDEETQNWVVGPSMTTPRANVEVTVVGDRLYAVGGFSGKTFLNTIEYLDQNSNEWTTFVPRTMCEPSTTRKKPRSRRNSRKSVSEETPKQASMQDAEKKVIQEVEMQNGSLLMTGEN